LIGVIAKISLLNGKEKEFEKVAKKLVIAVNSKERDNLFYRLYKESSHKYIFLEGYKDKNALTKHTKTDHYKIYGKEMAKFFDGSPEVIIMDELEPN
tara:strand:- start:16098 stop:16388 length:291 start_codon:yes stop_codon:yes gene_type:complete